MSAGRLPPHDLKAEASLLGAMMLSAEAAEIGARHLRAEDFYFPAHGHVFAAIVALWTEGQPIDAVTVVDALRRDGLLDTVGGAAFLVSLMAETPSISNASRYCSIISDMASYRAIARTASEAVEAALGMDGAPGEVVDRFRSSLNDVGVDALGQIPPDLTTLTEFMERPDDQRSPWAVPGLARIDWRVLLVGGEGAGKALRLDEPVPTPSGWTTIGEIEVGDTLFDLRGDLCRVTGVSPIDPNPETYRVTFSDGSSIEACADHQWATVTYRDRQQRRRGDGPPSTWPMTVSTTRELLASLTARGGFTKNHAIPVAGALDLPDADLPVDPYLLGVWLGDGASMGASVTLNTEDAPVILGRLALVGQSANLRPSSVDGSGACTYGLVGTGLQGRLRALGVLGDKHLPGIYLRAGEKQRQALLEGLMDTDGYCPSVESTGRGGGATLCELTFTNERLAFGAAELIRTLGMRCSISESEAKLGGRYVSQRWRVTFVPDRPVFSVPRKAQRQLLPPKTYRSQLRYIVSVEPCPPSPMRCLRVDSPDHTFLVSTEMVPTHNSTLLRQLAIAAAAGEHPFTHRPTPPIRTLAIDLENPDEAIEAVCAPMHRAVSRRDDWDPDRCWLWRRSAGLDLRRRHDRLELEEVLVAARPDLVCLGPVYKTYQASGKDDVETATATTLATLDDLRTRYRFALVLEHHAPHGATGKREMRPHGSVLWQRWPELGIAMNPVKDTERSFDLGRFRGDRLSNQWPDRIDEAAGVWAFEGVWPTGTFRQDGNDEMF